MAMGKLLQSLCKALCLLVLAMPATGTYPWWRVRIWNGQYFFVYSNGWHQALEDWEVDCLEEAFSTEPEMAIFIHGQSAVWQTPADWPPMWHPQSQQWLLTKEEPDQGKHWVAEGIGLESYWPGPKHRKPAKGSSRPPEPLTPPSRKGRWADVEDDGVDGDGKPYCNERGQSSMPETGTGGTTSFEEKPAEGSEKKPAKGSKTKWQCSWEAEPDIDDMEGEEDPYMQEPEKGYRFMGRGFHSDVRRQERRQLMKEGKPIPEHLRVREVELTVEAKRLMYELSQQTKGLRKALKAKVEHNQQQREPEPGEWWRHPPDTDPNAPWYSNRKWPQGPSKIPQMPGTGTKHPQTVEPWWTPERGVIWPQNNTPNNPTPMPETGTASTAVKTEGTPAQGGETGYLQQPQPAQGSEAKPDQEAKEEESEDKPIEKNKRKRSKRRKKKSSKGDGKGDDKGDEDDTEQPDWDGWKMPGTGTTFNACHL